MLWSGHSSVKHVRQRFHRHTHHDDSNYQGGQTNQVELILEQLDQFVVTALQEARDGIKTLTMPTMMNGNVFTRTHTAMDYM